MAKALLFADLHIHSHKDSVDRLHDCLQVLHWIFEQADKHEVQHILFLGDLFHERAKIDVLNYLYTFEAFMKHMLANKPHYDMWLLIGNHDMYHKEKWNVNSIKPLTAISQIHIVDQPSTISISGVNIDFCPHTENPIKELEKLKKGRDKDSLRLLLGHMAVHGAKLNKLYGTKSDVIVEYDNDMQQVGVDVFDGWDRVFLGHYHGAQQLSDNVEYIGSPLQLSFGEAFEEKHLVLLDLDTLEKTYIPNEFSPKHYILPPEEISTYQLKDNFVRIVVDNMSAKDVLDLRREIVVNHKVASVSFMPKDKKPEETAAVVEEAKAAFDDMDKMLDTYITNRGVPAGMDGKLIKEFGKRVLENVVV